MSRYRSRTSLIEWIVIIGIIGILGTVIVQNLFPSGVYQQPTGVQTD